MTEITKSDVIWQRAEGALVLVCTLVALAFLGSVLPWWALVLLFFAPDLTFLAYGAGPKFGGVVYNIVHLYGFGAAIALIGFALQSELAVICGILWIGHSGLDRLAGYGLKRPEAFKSTHMGAL